MAVSYYPRKTKRNGQIDPHTGKKIWQINVEAPEDATQVAALIDSLKFNSKKVGLRNALIFRMGVQTGLRISDILAFHRVDIIGQTQVQLREQKTDKVRHIYLDPMIDQINDYEAARTDKSIWMFPSSADDQHPVSRNVYYKALVKAADMINMKNIGTHSERKFFGRAYYAKTHDIATLMYIFNHSTEATTMRYLGLTEDRVAKQLRGFDPMS